MPTWFTFHKRNTFAGNGVGYDDGGGFPGGFASVAGVDDVADVVSVDFKDVPAESGEFIAEGFERHDVFRVAVNLDVVAIDDPGEVVELVFCGKHGGFPGDSAFQFAVGKNAVGVPGEIVHFGDERGTDGL